MATYSYRVIRSGRKTLGLEITENMEILVRAPRWVTASEIEGFVTKHESWIDRHMARRREAVRKRPEPTPAELVELTERAKKIIPGRVEYFGKIMGLRPTGLKITRAKTRFGSCSGKNSICFSCLLMGYPMEAVDYVVVHELAHILHKNHGERFWQTVESVLPDYRERRAMLRE